MFDRNFLNASFGVALAAAAWGFAAPGAANDVSCDEFVWPNYPVACLSAADGASIGDRTVRIAVGNPSAAVRGRARRERLPLAVAVTDVSAGPQRNEPTNEGFDGPKHFYPVPAVSHQVTVWRAGNPTVYVVTE
jgi:hypothetical protein